MSVNLDAALDELCIQCLSIPMDDLDTGDAKDVVRARWSELGEESRAEIRDAYRPAFEAVAFLVLREAADEFEQTDPIETALGGMDYPVEWLRTRAAELRK